MKFQILILLGFLAIISTRSVSSTPVLVGEEELEEEWKNFKEKFGRSYQTVEEEQERRKVFTMNLDLIKKHNLEYEAGKSSYQLGVNQFADWTQKEFSRLVTRQSRQERPIFKRSSSEIYHDDNVGDLPDEWDWTKHGVVTPVQDMGNCGDGYAFGPVAALESQQAIKLGKLIELSVQQVVDCSVNYFNQACQGGLIDVTYDYIMQNHGHLDTEQSYPYVGNLTNICHADNKPIGVTMKSYVDLPRFDEQMMQSAVAKIGPVAISLDADSPHFMLYKSGVYDYQDCNMLLIDHGMAVVGYGTLNGKKFWKVKNSMGTSWGVDGYLLIARDEGNLCGVASTPCYPVV